jgi:predicted Zn finger-like uncharacterized protein
MITACTGCQARYRLDAAKVPNRQIRVRCPDCGTIFDLDGTLRDEPSTLVQDTFAAAPAAGLASEPTPPPAPPPAEPAPRPAPAVSAPAQPVSGTSDLVLEPAAACVDQTVHSAREASPTPRAAATRQAQSATAVAEPPRPSRRTRRDKTEMLARALVSDILVYNQEARDRALADGTLLEVLGPEIKKSWELYKEKVGAETASSTSYFKDALNDILADGKAVF